MATSRKNTEDKCLTCSIGLALGEHPVGEGHNMVQGQILVRLASRLVGVALVQLEGGR